MDLGNVLSLCILTLYIHGGAGFSRGAPKSQCMNMFPKHSSLPKQESVAPFEVVVNKETYSPGESLTVTLKSTGFTPFKGFMLEARDEMQTSIIGGFTNIGQHKAIGCGPAGNEAVSHSSAAMKSKETVTWTAPLQETGDLVFVASFVQDYSMFWTQVLSPVIRQVDDTTTTAAPTTVVMTSAETSTTQKKTEPTTPKATTPRTMDTDLPDLPDLFTSLVTMKSSEKPTDATEPPETERLYMHPECGATKGCFVDCTDTGCNYVVSWQQTGDWMEFTLASKIDTLKNPMPWIAIAFSSDLKMGTDDVTQCIYDNGVVEVGRSRNDGKLNVQIDDSQEGLRNQRGEMVNGIFKCSFQRIVHKSGNRTKRATTGVLFNLNEDHYLMFGDGPASGSVLHMHQNNPVVTPRKVDFQSVDVIGDVARYPLVKVHASLMVIAWIFCSGVGIILSKFYKPVWSNRTILGLKVWFQLHRGLMVTTLVATCISFIIIFAEVGGYSKVAKIPGKEYTRAHPILGIIVTILCIINPIMALFRPGPDSKNRPFFNWAHWADGIAAQILAVITICFGVEMQKSTAPDYTVYVVIGYVIYQVLMEISLKLFDLCIDKRESEKIEALELKNGGSYQNGNSTQNANSQPNQANGNSYHMSPPNYDDSSKKNPKDSAIKKILFAFHVLVTLAFTLTLVLLVSMY